MSGAVSDQISVYFRSKSLATLIRGHRRAKIYWNLIWKSLVLFPILRQFEPLWIQNWHTRCDREAHPLLIGFKPQLSVWPERWSNLPKTERTWSFQIRFQYILAGLAKMYRNLIGKSPGFFPFLANMTYFGEERSVLLKTYRSDGQSSVSSIKTWSHLLNSKLAIKSIANCQI